MPQAVPRVRQSAHELAGHPGYRSAYRNIVVPDPLTGASVSPSQASGLPAPGTFLGDRTLASLKDNDVKTRAMQQQQQAMNVAVGARVANQQSS